MFKVVLADDHLDGKLLFTWLSLVMSFTVSFYAVPFPTRCLGWDLGLNWVSFWGFPYVLLHCLHRTPKRVSGLKRVNFHFNLAYFGSFFRNCEPGRVAQSVGHLTRKSGVPGSIPGLATYFRFSFRFFKKGSCQLLAKVCARSTG